MSAPADARDRDRERERAGTPSPARSPRAPRPGIAGTSASAPRTSASVARTTASVQPGTSASAPHPAIGPRATREARATKPARAARAASAARSASAPRAEGAGRAAAGRARSAAPRLAAPAARDRAADSPPRAPAPPGSLVRLALALARAVAAVAVSGAGQRALALAAFAGLFAWASLRVRDAVEQAPDAWLGAEALAAARPPRGMSEAALDDLRRLPFPGGRFNLHDPEAVPAIAAAYAALPWVQEVREVGIDFPARLTFDLVVREPAAGLRHEGALYLIDASGRVLPASRYAPPDPVERALPVLERAPLPARPLVPGERLAAPAIHHGLAVARALAEPTFRGLFAEPVTIDVDNMGGRRDQRRAEIVVRAGRTTIEWGRSPLAARLHVPTRTKLDRLALLIRADRDQIDTVKLEYDDLEWVPVGRSE